MEIFISFNKWIFMQYVQKSNRIHVTRKKKYKIQFTLRYLKNEVNLQFKLLFL